MKSIAFFLFMFLSGFVLLAQQAGQAIDHWFTIKNNRMVPVTSLDDHTLVYLNLDQYDREDTIVICHDANIDVWINNKLYFRQLPQACDKFQKAELIRMADQDSIVLSISYPRFTKLEALLIETDQKVLGSQMKYRKKDLLSRFYLMALLLVLILVAALKLAFPNRFSWLISNPLANRTLSDLDELYTGFWHLENLFTSLIFSFFVALQLIYLNHTLNVWQYLNTLDEQYFLQWLMLAGFIFAALLAKYVFSWVMSRLLQARMLPNIQFQDFLQIFIWFSFISVGLFFLDLYLISSIRFVLVDLAYYLIIGALLAFQLWLYFKFVKFYSHKKLLIISYLCTTEILPVFLIIFWLVK